MGIGRLWQIERALGGIRELDASLVEFTRVLEDLQQEGHVTAALDARYRGIRRWVASEAVKRRRRYEDVVHHAALAIGPPDPFLTLVTPAGVDGVIGALEQVLQARIDATHLTARANGELEQLTEQERAVIAQGPLGAIARLPFATIAGVAGFIERNLRVVLGLIVLLVAALLFPEWRLQLVALAIVTLFAERVVVSLRL